MSKLPCPPELWPAFSALLDQALDLPDSERPRWLAALGAEHAAVRPWLAKVITASGGDPGAQFMQELIVSKDPESEFVENQQVGPYLLQRRLGIGGMGEVWLAVRRDGSLNRQVALKLPYRHLLAGVQRRRFERERDILAALSHPHIAQLYDAGVADAHYPYLAMEWIDGVPINDRCQELKLSLDRRMDLFLQILDAVGYAHGQLIAHRDLKPSNILVTRDERVKLLDFGIAKLLAGDAENDATQLTRVGHFMATPAYAAPEQLAGAPITAAVDLYALGVVLHELLTGQRPSRENHKTSGGTSHSARASSQIAPDHAKFVGGSNPRQLRRAMSGDLDAIIAKALEPDPAQRYRSAEAFALDIKRSRDHRPISARRISTTTLALKFTRRHWVGVAMTAGLLFTLIGGSAGVAWQAVRAEREAQRATAIKDFLLGVFRASDPRIAADKPRGEITARELLDVSIKQIASSFAQQPETQIELIGVTADIYRELDETKRSTALYARETGLASRYFGSADVHTIDGLLGQAYNADADGNDTLALQFLDRADPLIRQAHLERTPVRARWLLMRGESLYHDTKRGEDARTSLEAAAALYKSVAPKDSNYPVALNDLAVVSLERSQFALSAGYYRDAIAAAGPNRRATGDLLLAYAGLPLALKYLGNFDGAATAFGHATDIAARTYGRDSNLYWRVASDWAQFRYERGERQAALTAFEILFQSLPDDRAAFRNATDALEAAQVLRKYGRCLAIDGQGTRAIPLLERAQSWLEKSSQHPTDVAFLLLDLGKAYEAGGRISEARESFLAAVSAFRALGAPPSQLVLAHEHRGRFLLAQNDANGAASEFNEALRLTKGQIIESTLYAQAGLAAIAVLGGNVHAALDASGQAMDQLTHIHGYHDVRVEPFVWGIRAQALLMAGDYEAARALAKRALDAARLDYAPESTQIVHAEALSQNLSSHPSPQ